MEPKIIECRLVSATRWIKQITSVAERAKSGYDWQGDFLHSNQLIDLPIGALVADCDLVGSRKHPEDRVSLRVLMPDGSWHFVAQRDGKEWASSMRKIAREWLNLTPDAAVERAYREWKSKLDNRRTRLAQTQALVIDELIAPLTSEKLTSGKVILPAVYSSEPDPIWVYPSYDDANNLDEAARLKIHKLVDDRIADIQIAVDEAAEQVVKLEKSLAVNSVAPQLTDEEMELVTRLKLLADDRRKLVIDSL